MFNQLPVLDIVALLSRGGGGLSIKVSATESGAAKSGSVVVIYFYLKSNLPSLINDFDEGSDSVPGDGEGKKRERERESWLPGLFGPGLQERESRVSGLVGEGRGIPVCSIQGRGAD